MPGKVLVPVRKFLRLLDYMEQIGLDPDAMALEQQPDGSGREPLAEARNDPPGHEDVLRHDVIAPGKCRFYAVRPQPLH